MNRDHPVLLEFREQVARAADDDLQKLLAAYATDLVAEQLIDRMPPAHRAAFLLVQLRRLRAGNGLDLFADLEKLAAEVPA